MKILSRSTGVLLASVTHLLSEALWKGAGCITRVLSEAPCKIAGGWLHYGGCSCGAGGWQCYAPKEHIHKFTPCKIWSILHVLLVAPFIRWLLLSSCHHTARPPCSYALLAGDIQPTRPPPTTSACSDKDDRASDAPVGERNNQHWHLENAHLLLCLHPGEGL